MKNRKICPKCNSTDIIKVPGKAGAYGVGNNIQTGWSNFSAVLVHRYVCCACGYSEEWIDKEDIPRLKEKYEKDRKKRIVGHNCMIWCDMCRESCLLKN